MDEREFSQRALSCARRLYGVAYLILGHDADCEDAVQEALLRAWAARDSLREERYFETWLVRILINESRRLMSRRRPEVALSDQDRPVEPENPALRDAIRALDIKFRLPVILYYVQGFKVREVARILHLPEGTVKWRLNQGRKLLRDLLNEEGMRV